MWICVLFLHTFLSITGSTWFGLWPWILWRLLAPVFNDQNHRRWCCRIDQLSSRKVWDHSWRWYHHADNFRWNSSSKIPAFNNQQFCDVQPPITLVSSAWMQFSRQSQSVVGLSTEMHMHVRSHFLLQLWCRPSRSNSVRFDPQVAEGW